MAVGAAAGTSAAGVPADMVRKGVLTLGGAEKAEKIEKEIEHKTGTVDLARLSKEQLVAQAQKIGLSITEAATKPALLRVLADAGIPDRIEIEKT